MDAEEAVEFEEAVGSDVRVIGLDHVVLRVTDMERSVAWYRDVLGLEPVRLDEWRAGTAPFVSMRIDDTTIIDLQLGEITGTNADHVALVVETTDLDEVIASGRFGEAAPPRPLFGARGIGQGTYVEDPDGHRIELRTYPATWGAIDDVHITGTTETPG